MFVVSMMFINLNLLYAILISYMSDARATQEVQEAKEWSKFMDKVYGFGNTVARALQLQARFRSCFPGLWSRMKTWEKNRMELEKKRDQRVAMRKKMEKGHDDIEDQLGSANPSFGRRKKRVYKQEINLDTVDVESNASETESEPDLGPLRFVEQLESKHNMWDPEHHDEHDDHHFHGHAIEDAHHDKENHHDHHHHHDAFGGNHQPQEVDRDEEAKELVLKATEHVVFTITERCRGVRALVVGEMGE